MKEMEIIAKCVNCKHCHTLSDCTGNYYCSKGKWHNKYYNQDICEHWKPSLSDMKLWIERETIKTKGIQYEK
jgi:hypothetical protein